MTQRPTVLVIDDHEDSRIILRTLLTHSGFDVVEAGGGREGIFHGRAAVPAVVLMELRMRELSGFETAMLLRLDRAFANVPMIAISGYPLEAEAAAAGFAAFLRKPFGMDALLRELRRVMPPTEPPMLLA
ncbi:MAG TPA: response regulator [Longimicrobiales bacterium]|nr:response regulator [Longimicrobiales bacterium]